MNKGPRVREGRKENGSRKQKSKVEIRKIRESQYTTGKSKEDNLKKDLTLLAIDQ